MRHDDYATQGAYFITLCTHNSACLFGHIRAGTMHLNDVAIAAIIPVAIMALIYEHASLRLLPAGGAQS